MRRFLALSALTPLVGAFMISTAPKAVADFAHACSTPDGTLCANADAGVDDVSKDPDGDYTTATNSQDVSAFFAVENRSSQTQSVTITLVLDGPGTSMDRTLILNRDVAPGDISQGNVALFKVHKKTPNGSYSWTVTGAGTETASATSIFTVV